MVDLIFKYNSNFLFCVFVVILQLVIAERSNRRTLFYLCQRVICKLGKAYDHTEYD